MSEEIREFSTTPKQESVRIDGDDYVIREMTDEEQESYMKALGKTLDVSMKDAEGQTPDGRRKMLRTIKVKDLAGARHILLQHTMRKLDSGDEVSVPMATIRSWPASLVTELEKIASRLSGMAEIEDANAKN